MATYLAPNLISVDAILQHGGKSVTIQAIVDSGAQTSIIDRQATSGLNLIMGDRIAFSGVGNTQTYGFTSTIDKIIIAENKDCTASNAPVIIGDLGLGGGIQALLGDPFMRQVGMIIDYSASPLKISCKKGQAVSLPEKSTLLSSPNLLIIGGLGFLGIGLLVLLFNR